MASNYFNAGAQGGFANALGGGNNKPVVVQGQAVNAQSTQTYNNAATMSDYSKPDRPARGCRDAFWAVLFYIHIGAMIYCAAAFAPRVAYDVAANGNRMLSAVSNRFLDEDAGAGGENEGYDYGGEEDIDVDPQGVLSIVIIAGVLGLVFATLALGFMISFAEILIKMALFFNIVLFGAMALLSLLGGAVGPALMFGMFCAFAAYYAYKVWSRIPFAASNMVTAVTAVRANLGLAFYAYWSLILLFLWSLLWAVSTMSAVYVLGDCDADGECQSEVNGGIIFLFLLSYYWTAQVISNVVHVTVAGTVGHWWHVPDEASSCCSKAVRDSYIRSLTTSFGSICLGSLIVALIQAMREMVNASRENGDSVVACCADCLLGCLERLVEYFNKWAFVYVGLYGFSFMEAGQNVMTLFRNRGWTAIIADLMVDTVLFMVSLGVGFLTALVAIIIGAAMGMGANATLGVAFLLGLIIGYAMCATLFSIVSSAVNTVIVLYAESPNEFQANHPQLSERMRESWRQAWPNDFNY